MTLFTITTEKEIYIFDDAGRSAVEAAAQKALNRGEWVKWEDGTTEYLLTVVDINDDHTGGSSVYIWDTASNRVRHTVTRVTVKDGRRQETFHKHVWRTA